MDSLTVQITEKIDVLINTKFPPAVKDKLDELEKTTKYKKAHIVGAVILIPVLLILALLGASRLIINLLGFVYPALQSFKAIDAKDSKTDTQWLSYWIIYGSFSIIEHAFVYVINAIMYYPLFKMGFLIWCYHPSTQGATTVYDKVLAPYVVPHLVAKVEHSD